MLISYYSREVGFLIFRLLLLFLWFVMLRLILLKFGIFKMFGVVSLCWLLIVFGIGEGILCIVVKLLVLWIDVNGCVGGFVSFFF